MAQITCYRDHSLALQLSTPGESQLVLVVIRYFSLAACLLRIFDSQSTLPRKSVTELECRLVEPFWFGLGLSGGTMGVNGSNTGSTQHNITILNGQYYYIAQQQE